MAQAPVMLRGNFSDLYGSSMLPVLEELFKSEMELHPSRREALFQTVSTDRDIWQYSELHDLPLFSSIAEGAEYSFERSKEGASKTFTITKYGSGFSISEEAVADGKFEMIGALVRKLASSAQESREIQAMNVFNNGFSGGGETTADGVEVFGSSHTLPSGGTFRNILSTAADLSESSLQTMMSDFETQQVGDSGIIKNVKPKILLVHSDNKRYAKELVGSEGKPDTADNNLNSLKEDGLMVISSPHLSDTDAWHLLADPSETGLRIIQRTGVETKAGGESVGFKTDSISYKARYREALGATHAYGIFGTPGA